jgi:mannose-6-phosphate isomerase-like protein (cupin superfamily)
MLASVSILFDNGAKPSGNVEDPMSESRLREWVERPWGRYSIIDRGKGHQIKLLVVDPGHQLSLQLHLQRDEHWIVLAGRCRARIGDEAVDLLSGGDARVPAKTVHRLSNLGQTELKVLETQFGDYLGEDDIERFEDQYGRA